MAVLNLKLKAVKDGLRRLNAEFLKDICYSYKPHMVISEVVSFDDQIF